MISNDQSSLELAGRFSRPARFNTFVFLTREVTISHERFWKLHGLSFDWRSTVISPGYVPAELTWAIARHLDCQSSISSSFLAEMWHVFWQSIVFVLLSVLHIMQLFYIPTRNQLLFTRVNCLRLPVNFLLIFEDICLYKWSIQHFIEVLHHAPACFVIDTAIRSTCLDSYFIVSVGWQHRRQHFRPWVTAVILVFRIHISKIRLTAVSDISSVAAQFCIRSTCRDFWPRHRRGFRSLSTSSRINSFVAFRRKYQSGLFHHTCEFLFCRLTVSAL